MRARRTILVTVAGGLAGLLVLAGVVVVVLAPRHGAGLFPDAAGSGPSWAPAGAAPVAASSASGSGAGSGSGSGAAGIAGLVDPAWATAQATATGIPRLAVLAYAGAALAKAQGAPTCKLSWTTLAAIGEIESGHGRHGGSSIGPDGTVTPPIYGVALNGDGVALIPDSDHGTIDGDPAADRAVGPMQLIPQTWRNWHTDGNADGVENPQNIFDAVMSTANYLCRASTALDTEHGWRAAIAAYNSAGSYLRKVARAAVAYNAAARA
ncbi:lytic transglycosylase domain-containing protein [Lysinimonas soli]|uniref:Lytic transglycosylase domain-containing protein n=1 Tax=Lysinimonas soli TaxID=1074233 RepID=A0ABW0NTN0_9MICO